MMKDSGCGITMDFSHLYARQQGKIDHAEVLTKLPKKFHAYFSGMQYGQKGEKKHLVTKKKFFEPLAKKLLEHKVDATLINESPQPYKDAAMMKKVLNALRGT